MASIHYFGKGKVTEKFRVVRASRHSVTLENGAGERFTVSVGKTFDVTLPFEVRLET
jgi:hypothetical protein